MPPRNIKRPASTLNYKPSPHLACLCVCQDETDQYSSTTFLSENILNLEMLLSRFHAAENLSVQNSELPIR
jgi:hypothetical protein